MDKLSYKLQVFEGPLDMLLFLISKNKLNIYDIPISELLDQYMEQIEKMREQNMDIASEFLEMAARLVYIKSVSLLPHQEEGDRLKDELSGELLEYQVCRDMAEKLSGMTDGFGCFIRDAMKIAPDKTYRRRHDKDELVSAYLAAVGRGQRRLPPPAKTFAPIVTKHIVSVSSKVVFVLRNLWKGNKMKFKSLFESAKSRSDAVATFLAVLELVKANRVKVEGERDELSVQMIKGGKRR